MTKYKYEVFIKGETVDLVIPNKNAIETDQWNSWFNDKEKMQFLPEHAMFPNTKKDQYLRLNKMVEMNKNRKGLFLLIKPKNTDFVIGVTSLSVINWKSNSAFLSIIIGSRKKSKDFIFWAFETKALMASHAFDQLGLQKVYGNQNMNLSEWQKYSLLLGFYPEGIRIRAIKKAQNYFDVIEHACLYEDYLKIKKKNNGNLWPGKEKFFNLMKKFPKENIYKQIQNENKKYIQSYLKKIYNK